MTADDVVRTAIDTILAESNSSRKANNGFQCKGFGFEWDDEICHIVDMVFRAAIICFRRAINRGNSTALCFLSELYELMGQKSEVYRQMNEACPFVCFQPFKSSRYVLASKLCHQYALNEKNPIAQFKESWRLDGEARQGLLELSANDGYPLAVYELSQLIRCGDCKRSARLFDTAMKYTMCKKQQEIELEWARDEPDDPDDDDDYYFRSASVEELGQAYPTEGY